MSQWVLLVSGFEMEGCLEAGHGTDEQIPLRR
jgi:hypothetical protein